MTVGLKQTTVGSQVVNVVEVTFAGNNPRFSNSDIHAPRSLYCLPLGSSAQQIQAVRARLIEDGNPARDLLEFASNISSEQRSEAIAVRSAQLAVTWGPAIAKTGQQVHTIGSLAPLSYSACAQNGHEELLLIGLKSKPEVLDQLDAIKTSYRNTIGRDVGLRRQACIDAATTWLTQFSDPSKKAAKQQGPSALESFTNALQNNFLKDLNTGALPRVLILGESGSGKSLTTQYLAARTSAPAGETAYRRFVQIAVPNYLGREEDFLGDLFGYLPGAYTGARGSGNLGIALQNLGGMIFFDEIGDASAFIQAKLLTFLDNYRSQPRDWERAGFVCPALVVAATNKPIKVWAQNELQPDSQAGPTFRHDLLWRFNHVIELPSLNACKDNFDNIIDAQLQLTSINPGPVGSKDLKDRPAQAFTTEFIDSLKKIDYSNGNYRQLGRLLIAAVSSAVRCGSSVLQSEDIAESKV